MSLMGISHSATVSSRRSADPKFEVLVDYVLKSKGHFEVGILGMNPQTGTPMTIGVS